jgi:hypothetical protein
LTTHSCCWHQNRGRRRPSMSSSCSVALGAMQAQLGRRRTVCFYRLFPYSAHFRRWSSTYPIIDTSAAIGLSFSGRDSSGRIEALEDDGAESTDATSSFMWMAVARSTSGSEVESEMRMWRRRRGRTEGEETRRHPLHSGRWHRRLPSRRFTP